MSYAVPKRRDRRGALPVWSKPLLIGAMKALAGRLGRTPSAVDIQRAPRSVIPATNTFIYHFGSLGAAQLAAELPLIDRGGRRWSHCARGHELTPENLYTWFPPSHPKGTRRCRECHCESRRNRQLRELEFRTLRGAA